MTRSTIILITILLFSTFVYGQSDSYPGLIKIVHDNINIPCHYSYENNTKTYICKSDTLALKFYKTPDEKNFDKKLTFYYTPDRPIAIKHLIEKNHLSWLNPFHFKSDTVKGYFQIYFICKTKKDNWYEVVINEESGETRWINDKHSIKLFTWNKINYTDLGICVNPKYNIYTKADSSLVPINFNRTDFFEIIETKGNWMKIKAQNGQPCGNSTEKTYFAWFNYKSKDNLYFNSHIYGFIFN
jgi:hypothetical protein